MNKMMLTPTPSGSRPAGPDLLSQLGSARGVQDGEASAAFAQLLQAKGGTLMSTPAVAAQRQTGIAGPMPAPPMPGAPQAAAPRTSAHTAAPAPAPARPDTESSHGVAGDLARRQEAARVAGRRTTETQARDRQAANADSRSGVEAPEDEAQDPVLAQVLRHLRKDEPRTDGELDPAAEDSSTDSEDPPADASLAAAVPQAQLLPPDGQKPLPAAAEAALASAESLGRRAGTDVDGVGEGMKGMKGEPGDASRLAAAADAGTSDRAGGALIAAAQAGARSAEPLSARPDEAGLALDATAKAGKLGEGSASDKAAALPPPGFAGLLQQAQAGAVHERGPGSAGVNARYELQSPLHAAGFAPEMAARLSLAATEGVQQAQLHLNPSEMGPVQVQIVLDGQQAQISFVAEQADTRAVLEKSLPELAGALREQGLTLSGGGVFSQQQQQAQPGQSGQADRDGGPAAGRWASSRQDTGAADEAAAAQQRVTAASTRSRGVLDLFA